MAQQEQPLDVRKLSIRLVAARLAKVIAESGLQEPGVVFHLATVKMGGKLHLDVKVEDHRLQPMRTDFDVMTLEYADDEHIARLEARLQHALGIQAIDNERD